MTKQKPKLGIAFYAFAFFTAGILAGWCWLLGAMLWIAPGTAIAGIVFLGLSTELSHYFLQRWRESNGLGLYCFVTAEEEVGELKEMRRKLKECRQ